jgi:hypothetical protein
MFNLNDQKYFSIILIIILFSLELKGGYRKLMEENLLI